MEWSAYQLRLFQKIPDVYLNSEATLRRSVATPATRESILGLILILNVFTTKRSLTYFWCFNSVYTCSQSVSRHTLGINRNNLTHLKHQNSVRESLVVKTFRIWIITNFPTWSIEHILWYWCILAIMRWPRIRTVSHLLFFPRVPTLQHPRIWRNL